MLAWFWSGSAAGPKPGENSAAELAPTQNRQEVVLLSLRKENNIWERFDGIMALGCCTF